MNPSSLKFFALAALVALVLSLAPHALADPSTTFDTNAALNPPTSANSITTGLNQVLSYVFMLLKFLAIIACGYGSYQMWKGELSSGVWSYVAALALFFAPALVNLAQSIGSSAAGNTSLEGRFE